ncbi:hypothetical protein CLHUN_01940 [Ruminiclostridium hungatei]|uniref:Uncharacterized protein n=1 Tax=Ruminiclostridium hungatei TaxID=48256 RepID=A0A1V4SR58_RUMHU|nr:hypothetical protein [Ruminiclostridium hungatei]OPX46378.1 hypothetical protein CLHUN_01940 [Ruminiclostridium hungatei]
MNPFSISGHWRIDPDNRQDRKDGRCLIRKMTPEEVKEYGPATVQVEKRKSEIAAIPGMVRKDIFMKKIKKERLIEICSEHGFTAEAYKIAAKEFAVSISSVKNYVSTNNLKSDVVAKKLHGTEESSLAQHKPDILAETPCSANEELEIITRIKSILQENHSLTGENTALKENMSKVKAALEDILKLIA